MVEDRRPRIMTIDEVARYLRVNRSTIYRFIKVGEIPAFKVGNQWRFRKDSIDSFFIGQGKTERSKTGLRQHP
jgi:excisionase family DNA binding protein